MTRLDDTPTVEHVSESEHLGWLFTLVGADQMITNPTPHYAHTQADHDWYLRQYGPAEKYVITRVPDRIHPDARAKIERMKAEHADRTSGDTP